MSRIQQGDITQLANLLQHRSGFLARRRAEGQQLFAANGRVQGVDLEVVELVGEPGDVYLMDLRALHTRCPNTLPTPRMMIAQRFILASVRSQIRRRYFELDSQ